MLISKLGIPENFAEKLPDLKSKTLKWETIYKSGTQINSKSTISFYQSLTPNVGNLILIPGLASNSKIDPLMKAIQYWGLTHRYNIINIDSFLGDIENDVTPDNIHNNTYPELKTVLTGSIKFVQPYTMNKHTCVIGHCVSASLITDILNDCVKNQEQVPVQSAILFAPFPKIPQSKYDAIMSRRMQIETENKNISILDPVTTLKLKHMKFVCAMQEFVKSVENVAFEPKIIAQWGIPVSFVVAGRDKISPASRAKENFELLSKESGPTKPQYLYLPERKHTFEQLYANYKDIIQIIKTQRGTKQRKN